MTANRLALGRFGLLLTCSTTARFARAAAGTGLGGTGLAARVRVSRRVSRRRAPRRRGRPEAAARSGAAKVTGFRVPVSGHYGPRMAIEVLGVEVQGSVETGHRADDADDQREQYESNESSRSARRPRQPLEQTMAERSHSARRSCTVARQHPHAPALDELVERRQRPGDHLVRVQVLIAVEAADEHDVGQFGGARFARGDIALSA